MQKNILLMMNYTTTWSKQCITRPHHPDLDSIPAKHPTRVLKGAIHYQLKKCLFTKFTTSQSDVADLSQVERKKFFTSITGREYDVGKKPTKAEKETEDTST